MTISLWTPEKIETALWLDAADSSTITLESGAVSQWADKSGNGRDATQATGSAQPVYNSIDQSITFDGSDDFMTADAVSDYLGTNNDWVIVGVINAVNYVKHNAFSLHRDGSNILHLHLHRIWSSTADSNFRLESDVPLETTHINCWCRNTASTFSFYEDGSQIGDTLTKSDQVTLLPTANQFSLAQEWDGSIPSDFAAFVYYEVVIAALADRMKIEGYLAHKWGLEANLPTDHPYKLYAPRSINGIITDRLNNPCSRTVYCIDRDLGDTRPTVIDYTTSNPITGEYELVVPAPGEYCVVALSEENDNLNDLITRVTVDE